MADESEWKKLPTDEKVAHSQWKARMEGYEEALKLFKCQTDEKSPEFNKYLGLLKKMVLDSNAIAQEKALEVALCYVENAAVAAKMAGEICSAVVSKCLGAARQKTKERAMEILLMYIEIERQETVQEELMKGLQVKQPKVVVGSIQTLCEALRQFGTKVLTLKPIVKETPRLLEDRDKNIRDETKALVVEIYRWIGQPIKGQLSSLKPVLLTELESEFANIQPGTAVPERYLRSQQAKMALEPPPAPGRSAGDGAGSGAAAAPVPEVDPLEFISAVEVISKIPKDFFDKIEEKKWQDRREALEAVDKLTDVPKLESGDFADLVRALLKVVAKDSNVMLVALGAKILGQIAKGLRKKYMPYASQTVKVVLDKFKEKKTNVVAPLRETIDAAFFATNLEAVSEDVITALDSKNPNIKTETALFLARTFKKCTQAILNKKMLKLYVVPLVKTMSDTAPEVREAAYEALGNAMRIVTERNMMPFLGEIDPLKMARVKEFFDKAQVGTDAAPAAAAAAAPPAKPASAPPGGRPKLGGNKPIGAARPGTAGAVGAKKVPAGGAAKKAASGGQAKKGAAKKGAGAAPSLPTEPVLSDEQVEDKAKSLFGEECLTQLANANWKERVAGMETVQRITKDLVGDELPCQVVIKLIGEKKPGMKDNNFQVLKLKLEQVAHLAQNGVFTTVAADVCLGDILDKMGDVKNGEAAKTALTMIAEACTIEYIGMQVVQSALQIKNPKNQAEAFNWLSQAIKDFGLKLSPKDLIAAIRGGLQATNPAVRQAAIGLTATLYLYMGESLRALLADEKPALLQQIDTEIEKVKGQRPPAPTRGLLRGGAPADDEEQEPEEDEGDGGAVEMDDLLPRVDISNRLTDDLKDLVASKNWKERQEGLSKIQGILDESKSVKGDNLNELGGMLAKLGTDSNKIIAKNSLSACESLAKAMTKSDSKGLARTVVPGLLTSLGDGKPHVRQAAVSALNAWCERCTLPFLAEGETFSDALKLENPFLRIELLGWLSEKLTALSSTPAQLRKLPVEFRECLPSVYTCLEDRNADVRKKSQEALLPFMLALGFEVMAKAAGKVRPSSKDLVRGMIDKTREQLPAPSAPAKAMPPPAKAAVPGGKRPKTAAPAPTQAPAAASDDEAPPTAPPRAKSASAVRGGGARNAAQLSTKKKDAPDEPIGPPLNGNSNKDQRFLDEKKRKLLKWEFDAPQREHTEQLNGLFQANCSGELHAQLFHSDFKQHIRAVETLSRFLDDGGQEALDATRANLDLILKWMVLRFFETNPSFLMRGLEYLNKVFASLSEASYNLAEQEAQSFLPFLVVKAGDPKDNIRRDVRSLFKLFCRVYPASKLFNFLMEGTKAKTARQRQECLEEVGCLIEMYGINVCQPSPSPALKGIAQQIGDRDSGVRTAALNTLVICYNILGEQIYKLVGNLTDKDRSMLEERIKRAGKYREGDTASTASVPSGTFPRPNSRLNLDKKEPPTAPPRTANRPPEEPTKPCNQGEFQLEVGEDEMEISRYEMPRLIQVENDLDDIYKPIDKPNIKARPASPSMQLLRNSVDATSAITMVTTQISATDISTSIQALAQIDEVIQHGEKCELLINYVDQLVMMVTMQLKMSTSKHIEDPNCSPEEITRLLKCLLATLLSLYSNATLARETSRDRLKELLCTLIQVMLDERVVEMAEGGQVVRSINILCVRVIENSDKTRVLCSLLRLMYECVESGNYTSNFLKLVMKCVWRVTRNLQTTVSEYALDAVLQQCHMFLKSFPSAFWKTKRTDVPLRTVKTLLHTLCQLKGPAIVNQLDTVTNKEDSELESYVLRTIKSYAGANVDQQSTLGDAQNSTAQSPAPGSSATYRRSSASKSAATHDRLAEIFKKIGSKEQTREGLNDLYDFKLANPDADLTPYLARSSQFFQSYIEQGLKNIEVERDKAGRREQLAEVNAEHAGKKAGGDTASAGSGVSNSSSGDTVLNPQIFIDRLKLVRREFGLDTSTLNPGAGPASRGPHTSASTPALNKTSDVTLDVTLQSTHKTSSVTGRRNTEEQENQDFRRPSLTQNEVNDLRRRLEKIKSSQK